MILIEVELTAVAEQLTGGVSGAKRLTLTL